MRESPVRPASLSRDLPEFDRPPVIEVAASIQFDPIEGLNAARLGLLWAEYRDRYPRAEHHAPLATIIESFDSPSPSGIGYSLESTMPVPRLWFLNQQGTRLLQVQEDRFGLNWRKLDTEEAYPHYPELRAALEHEFQVFQQFLEREGLSRPTPNQAELTYVNYISARTTAGEPIPVTKVVTLWGDPPRYELLSIPESVGFESRYVMGAGAKSQGRLYVKLETRYRVADAAPVYVLQLIGRGAPAGGGLPGTFRFLDEAHREIVQVFALVTTTEMHHAWGRTR